MPQNNILPLKEEIVNKIAAGEVIEKPSCLLRELLDNSLDAKANQISVLVHFHPFKLIVEDDGIGIEKEQVALAFKRHTTSKIRDLNDIYTLTTRGFRGEALAAIASVAEVNITTKTPTNDTGIKMTIKGGEIIKREELACKVGTKIAVKNLFYNAPVRKKFITTIDARGSMSIKSQEKKNLKEQILHHALASKGVAFNYAFEHGKKTEEIIIPNDFTLREKINFFFSAKHDKNGLLDHLLEVNEEHNGFHLKGFVSDLTIKEKNAQQQFLIMNNKVIKDYRFTKALQTAYQSRLPWGTHPLAFICVVPPKETVDINVHPQKKEVRFRNNQDFFQAVYYGIRNCLDKELIKKQKSGFEKSPTFFYGEPRENSNHMTFADPEGIGTSSIAENTSEDFLVKTNQLVEPMTNKSEHSASKNKAGEMASHFKNYPNLKILGQVDLCYIIFTIENNLYITDQHAAHERINFDKINKALQEDKSCSQSLLIPIIIRKSFLEKEMILNQKNLLEKFHLGIEDFGEKNLRVLRFPNFIKENKMMDVLNGAFEAILQKENLDLEDLTKDIASRMACRMSIMKGDYLSLGEMEAIIKEVYVKDYIQVCPHGRPFVKKITADELASFFDRNKHIRGSC